MDWGAWGAAVSTECQELRDAATTFCDRNKRPVNSEDLGEQLIHLSQTIDVLRREQAQLAGAFCASDEWELQGSASPIDWLRHNGRMSLSDAAKLAVVGRHFGDLPKSSAAVDRGEIGFGHMVQMARNASFIARRGKGGVFNEDELLEKAVGESVSRFHHTCRNMRHVQDPDGVVNDEAGAVEMRELNISHQDDGLSSISLHLDRATAVMIESDITRRSKKCGPDDTRSRIRRMADTMIERLLGEGGPNVDITISCTPESLLGLNGAPAAQLEYVEPISGEMLRRHACNAMFTKILVDGKYVSIDASSRRVPTKKERKAMDATQKICQGRGCRKSARQCSPHHITWYAQSHRTDITEMILLCPYHHWMAHEGGWDVALKDDGEVLFIPPFARGPTRTVAA